VGMNQLEYERPFGSSQVVERGDAGHRSESWSESLSEELVGMADDRTSGELEESRSLFGVDCL
jgi:hypothetical protein